MWGRARSWRKKSCVWVIFLVRGSCWEEETNQQPPPYPHLPTHFFKATTWKHMKTWNTSLPKKNENNEKQWKPWSKSDKKALLKEMKAACGFGFGPDASATWAQRKKDDWCVVLVCSFQAFWDFNSFYRGLFSFEYMAILHLICQPFSIFNHIQPSSDSMNPRSC